MRTLHLTALVFSVLVFACGEKDATVFDPAGQEWEFSLSNPVPVVINTNRPKNLPLAFRPRYEVLGPGDVLRVEGDTLFVENDYRVTFSGLPRTFRLFTTDDHPDSLAGFKLSQGVGTTLNVAYYHGDTLKEEWLFEQKQQNLKEIAFGELDGQTYRCAFPGGDSMQVHFSTTTSNSTRNKGEKMEYLVEELTGFAEPQTRPEPGGIGFWGGRMIGMRKAQRYFSSPAGAFGSKRYKYGRNKDGGLVASYIKVDSVSYELVNMPLVRVPNQLTSENPKVDFSDRINSGRVVAGVTYPRIDSALVEYRYQKDFKGIDYDELSELEFSADPDGEFIVVVRDRLLWNRKWRLSPDGRYLITLDKQGREYGHYPILAYTNEFIDLRMPFSVKTREPRGVALESYADLDVFIRIAKREDATSR